MAFGDVLVDRDQAALRHALVRHLDDAAVGEVAQRDHVAVIERLDISGVEVVARHVRVAEVAERDAVFEHLAHGRAGLHHVGRHAEHLDIAPVAHDQPHLRVQHGEAVRHVVERDVETAVLLAQLLGGTLALGHVLEGTDPAADLERQIPDGDQPAIREPAMHDRFAIDRHAPLEILEELFGAQFRRVHAVRQAVADEIDRVRAGPRVVRRQPIDVEVALVAHDHTPVLVEHAQPMPHVLKRGIEQDVLFAQRLFVAEPLGHILVRRNPAAARRRARGDFDHLAVLEREPHGRQRLAAEDGAAVLINLVN